MEYKGSTVLIHSISFDNSLMLVFTTTDYSKLLGHLYFETKEEEI